MTLLWSVMQHDFLLFSWRAQWLHICCQDIISASCLHGHWSTCCCSCYFCSTREYILNKMSRKFTWKLFLFFLNLKLENNNTPLTLLFVIYVNTSWHFLLSSVQVLGTSLRTQRVGGSFASSTLCSEYLCSASSWLVWAISWAAYSAKGLAEWRKCLWWV